MMEVRRGKEELRMSSESWHHIILEVLRIPVADRWESDVDTDLLAMASSILLAVLSLSPQHLPGSPANTSNKCPAPFPYRFMTR